MTMYDYKDYSEAISILRDAATKQRKLHEFVAQDPVTANETHLHRAMDIEAAIKLLENA